MKLLLWALLFSSGNFAHACAVKLLNASLQVDKNYVRAERSIEGGKTVLHYPHGLTVKVRRETELDVIRHGQTVQYHHPLRGSRGLNFIRVGFYPPKLLSLQRLRGRTGCGDWWRPVCP